MGKGIPEHQDLTKQANEEFLGQRGQLVFITHDHGLKIANYFWPAATERPRAILYIVHGHGSYLTHDYLASRGPGKLQVYTGSWVEALNNAGVSVSGVDFRGAGRSEGERCYASRFSDYVCDVVEHVKLSTTQGVPGFPDPATQPLPQFMMGGSMGGCVAVTMAAQQAVPLSGLILLAPMLSLEKVSKKGLNPYLRPMGNLISSLFPKLPTAKVAKGKMFPELQREFDEDANNWTAPTRARNAMEYLAATQRLMAPGGLEAVAAPFLLFHGLKDDMTDPDGSRALHARAKSTDKTIKLLPDSWHVLTKEPGVSKEVLSDILAWVSARCDAGPASPTSPAAHSLPTPNGGSAAAAAAAGAAAELPETLASPKP